MSRISSPKPSLSSYRLLPADSIQTRGVGIKELATPGSSSKSPGNDRKSTKYSSQPRVLAWCRLCWANYHGLYHTESLLWPVILRYWRMGQAGLERKEAGAGNSLNKREIINHFSLDIYKREQHRRNECCRGLFICLVGYICAVDSKAVPSSSQICGQTPSLGWELRFWLYHIALTAKAISNNRYTS